MALRFSGTPEPTLNTMLDHAFISVSDIDHSIDFYAAAVAPQVSRTTFA
jgi:hypothetical protein